MEMILVSEKPPKICSPYHPWAGIAFFYALIILVNKHSFNVNYVPFTIDEMKLSAIRSSFFSEGNM